jgi:tetratricopeptide (TPR) repeat protein
VNARLGMAQEMDTLCESANAIEQLQVVIRQKPIAPYAALARAYYQLGTVLDRIGRRSEAIAAYRSALASIPTGDRLRLREKAREAIGRTAVRVCPGT